MGSGRCVRFQFSSGRLNVVDEDTRLMALSELEKGVRQFRIGPKVDVGLVIASVLGWASKRSLMSDASGRYRGLAEGLQVTRGGKRVPREAVSLKIAQVRTGTCCRR